MLLYDVLLLQVSVHITVMSMKYKLDFLVLNEKKNDFYFKSFNG